MSKNHILNKLAALPLLALLFASTALGQGNLARAAGKYVASNYGRWQVTVANGNTATGAQTITLNQGAVALPDGRTIVPFSVTAPITLDYGSNAETVTPTAVSGCQPGGQVGSCQITATFTYTHGQGTPVVSGSFGLQEAVNAAFGSSSGGGVVVIDSAWRGTSSTIAAALPYASVTVEDDRGPLQYWATRPTTLTLISAGAAPTTAQSAGGSLTDSGTYYVVYEYVDINGGISLPSTATSQITLSSQNTITISAVPAATGAVCYIPMITASAGSDGTQIEVPVTSSVCTLTTLETIKPACAIGNTTYNQSFASAAITANPSATAKEVVKGTAHTTAAFQPFSSVPALGGIQTTYGPFAATSTVSSTALVVAQTYLAAGALNYLNKEVDVCFDMIGTIASTGVPSITLLAANQFEQSAVTLATVTFATQTGASDFQGCFSIQTAATGATGTFWAKTLGPINLTLNATPSTNKNQGQVTSAVSSSIDLTKQLYLYIKLVSTTADTTSVTVNQLSLRTPAS